MKTINSDPCDTLVRIKPRKLQKYFYQIAYTLVGLSSKCLKTHLFN